MPSLTSSEPGVRVDASGIVERVGFLGDGPDHIFGVLHAPADGAGTGVVVCPPVHAEFEKNYRSEVLLGREVASRGMAARRFHYRGHGHSDGDPDATTFEAMVEDAATAEASLRAEGVERVAFLGTRWGALVAAAAAARTDDAPVVLWEPVLEADVVFRDAFRARRVGQLKSGSDGGAAADPREELRRSGATEAMGYAFSLALYDSATGRTLDDALGTAPRRVLLMQIGRASELRSSFATAAEGWRARGLDVETRVQRGEEGWWFATIGERWQPSVARTDRDLLASTAEWLERELAR